MVVDLSGESVVPADPQTWNRYTYALNNPILLIDKRGQFSTKKHDEIYARALPGLRPDQLAVIREASKAVDSWWHGGQSPSHAYQHSMSSPGQSKNAAANAADDFIARNLAKAIHAQNEWTASGNSGLSTDALRYFGKAAHALSDADAPQHANYQEWKGLLHLVSAVEHAADERNPPQSSVDNAVADVQSAFVAVFGVAAGNEAMGDIESLVNAESGDYSRFLSDGVKQVVGWTSGNQKNTVYIDDNYAGNK